jgi:amidophosphoribosyltransferase
MQHHCGLYGISDSHANYYLINGLKKLQHRGYEGCGISYISKTNEIITYKGLGKVDEVFKDYQFEFPINMGISHVRYSTTVKSDPQLSLDKTQPLIGKISNEQFALAHNGNIPDVDKIKNEYGFIIDNHSDTFVLLKLIEHLYTTKYHNLEDTLKYIINIIPGAYCLLVLTKDKIYALRDQFGIRPLVIGKSKKIGYCFASESVALENFDFQRDVIPGEIVMIDNSFNLKTIYQCQQIPTFHFCSFEYIYFMDPHSFSNNQAIEKIRYNLGFVLGTQEKDILDQSFILAIPNSSIAGSTGFAHAIKKKYKKYILKSKTIDRTFILPTNEERKIACDNKFTLHKKHKMTNKNIYIVDDSIVRGNTLKSLVMKIKKTNPQSIHLRIISPPIISPCYYGIDFPSSQELIAYQKTIEEIKKELDVDSLKYLDLDSMTQVFGHSACTSCFTGIYNKKLLDW